LSHQLSSAIDPAGALTALRVSSLSHRTCGLTALGGVVAHGDAARIHAALSSAGVESIVLSTCNRFEVYWRAQGPGDDRTVEAMLDASLPMAKDLLRTGAIHLTGEDAAAHLFRVCSGLESMVLGEAEILGQARIAMEQAPGAGSFLKGVFTAAIRTGRGARARTGIANGAMSVASVAVRQLRDRMTMPDSCVVIVGAGETAAKIVRQTAAIGVASLVIANRTVDRADALAGQYGGRAVALDSLVPEIARADAVVCAAGADGWMVTRQHVGDRRAKPIVLVDLAMPPGIEPFDADGVTRIDLVAIEGATADYRRRREAEIPSVNAFIRRELGFLGTWAQRESSRPARSARL
jgi:glutamyl-tRNA reductase